MRLSINVYVPCDQVTTKTDPPQPPTHTHHQRAICKVMLHQLYGPMRCHFTLYLRAETISVSFQVENWSRLKNSLFLILLQHSSSNSIHHVPHSPLAEGNDASSSQLTSWERSQRASGTSASLTVALKDVRLAIPAVPFPSQVSSAR